MHPVTYPPFGTARYQLGNRQDSGVHEDVLLTGTNAPVVVQFTRVRVRADLLHRCGFLPGRHCDLFLLSDKIEESICQLLSVYYYIANKCTENDGRRPLSSEV